MQRTVLLLCATAALAGCETMQPKVELAPARPVEYVQVPQAQGAPTGSLFRPATYRPGFEDPRARLPGDTITIQITERVTASQNSSASIDRSANASAGVSAFPLLSAATLGKLDVGAQSNNQFEGEGKSEANNTFNGSITATVQEVLPNGHLVVVGEKQIGVNANVDVMRFSGTVDPRTIRPGNVVTSTQVANARIESRNRGAQGEAMSIGWLARFFLSVIPF
ncbi:flagellar basal body L-ring protein FlgH [uncultured Hydrogenophaga sp.]|uniref:flagellar basal body L-ring protein FlgH n=1 Tax=uncultured Hydrogenophaga sp. TaxID=199683 RepID=UPI00265E193C|nr:flagellar basal body L-ring protein FlgH [uncultured Hydrogenophaga sp.]